MEAMQKMRVRAAWRIMICLCLQRSERSDLPLRSSSTARYVAEENATSFA